MHRTDNLLAASISINPMHKPNKNSKIWFRFSTVDMWHTIHFSCNSYSLKIKRFYNKKKMEASRFIWVERIQSVCSSLKSILLYICFHKRSVYVHELCIYAELIQQVLTWQHGRGFGRWQFFVWGWGCYSKRADDPKDGMREFK